MMKTVLYSRLRVEYTINAMNAKSINLEKIESFNLSIKYHIFLHTDTVSEVNVITKEVKK